MELKLSIIVVTYNCGAFIGRFLSELSSSLMGYSKVEILLNDNQSTDDTYEICQQSLQLFKGKLLLSNSENIGFAKANNILIARASYENILLLNPDVFGFNVDFWSNLMLRWDRENPMFIKLLNEDLTVQESVGDELSVKRRFKNHLGMKINYSLSTKTVEVETGIMAFVLIPATCFQTVGLLSEKYYMYAEDHDWFYRARRKGYKLIFEPSLVLVHIGGGSAKSKWKNKELNLFKLKVERMFIDEHFKGVERWILIMMNLMQRYMRI